MHLRVAFFLLAVPFLLAATFWQLDVKTDISAFFISGKSEQMKLLAGQMQNGEISKRYLISIVQEKVGEKPLEFVQALQTEWLKLEGVSRVWGSSMGDDEMHALIAFYLPYRYQLYSLTPEKDVPAIFSNAAMEARAKTIKQGLLSPESAWVREVIHQDPMFLMSNTFGQLSSGISNSTEHSRYTSLMVESNASGLDTDRQAVIKKQIEAVFQQVNRTYGSKYQLEMTGVPIFALAIKKQVEEDVKWISSVSIGLMLLLFLVIFRSFQSLVTVTLILLVSATMACLLTSLVFGQIYALTLAIGTTLIGVCVDYPIHTMVHAQASTEHPVDAAKRIWPSLLLGAATTMVGYTALSFTGYPGMQQIALYSGIGILTSLLISRFILPFSIHAQRKTLQSNINFDAWLLLMQGKSLKVPVIILALLVLWSGLSGVRWEDDLSQLSPSVNALKENDQRIRARMQSIEPGRFILIHADNIELALQQNEAVCLRLNDLKKAGKLESFYSLYPWLASQKLQQENTRLARLNLTDIKKLGWSVALEKEGLRSAFFVKPEVPTVPTLTLTDVLKSSAARYISGQYVINDKQVILTIWLGLHDPAALKEAFSGVEGAQYVSQKDMINEMNAAYRRKAVIALAYGALLIVLLLTLRYRSFKASIQALFPAMISVAFVVGGWGLSGYPLSMLHLLGLLLLVAICVDYGIFFHENRSDNMRLTYQAIVISALTTMVAFSCLALAENPALKVLAWTIAPGVLLGFLLCPLLIQKPSKG
ncbi:MAG: MMPL family transporter [Mariprofundaceae bacterium]|nr:MMPL family transporter [Mariprofundaceae bacterium]